MGTGWDSDRGSAGWGGGWDKLSHKSSGGLRVRWRLAWWGRTQRLGLWWVLRCPSWGAWTREGGKVAGEDTEGEGKETEGQTEGPVCAARARGEGWVAGLVTGRRKAMESKESGANFGRGEPRGFGWDWAQAKVGCVRKKPVP